MSISLAVLRQFECAKHQKWTRFKPCIHCYRPGGKRFASNRYLQCATACPIFKSPMIRNQIMSTISCSIAAIRMRPSTKMDCFNLAYIVTNQVESDSLQIGLYNALNSMSKYLSPQCIRNQKMSISLAVLQRFECAKHQKWTVSTSHTLLPNQVESDSLQIGLYNA